MANSYNKIILVGNLGRDGELAGHAAGQAGALDQPGGGGPFEERRPRAPGTEWYRIKVWGRQRKRCRPSPEGKSILVEGRLSIQTWTDREGHNRYTPEVSADRVVLLGSPGGQGSAASREPHVVDELDQAPADINADDIPF